MEQQILNHREWLVREIDPIIKPLVVRAMEEQPANFEEWLLAQLKAGDNAGQNTVNNSQPPSAPSVLVSKNMNVPVMDEHGSIVNMVQSKGTVKPLQNGVQISVEDPEFTEDDLCMLVLTDSEIRELDPGYKGQHTEELGASLVDRMNIIKLQGIYHLAVSPKKMELLAQKERSFGPDNKKLFEVFKWTSELVKIRSTHDSEEPEEVDSEESGDEVEARNTLFVTKEEAMRALLWKNEKNLAQLAEAVLDRIIMPDSTLALDYLPVPFEGQMMLFKEKSDVIVLNEANEQDSITNILITIRPLRAISASNDDGVQITVRDPDTTEDISLTLSKVEIQRLMPQYYANTTDEEQEENIDAFWTLEVGADIAKTIRLVKLKGGMKLVLPARVDQLLYFKERKFGPDDHRLISVYKLSPEVLTLTSSTRYPSIDDEDYDESKEDSFEPKVVQTMLLSKAEAKYATDADEAATLEDIAEMVVGRLTQVRGQIKLKYKPKPYTGPKMLKEIKTTVKVFDHMNEEQDGIHTLVSVKPLRAVSATLGDGVQISVQNPATDDEPDPEDLGMLTFGIQELKELMPDTIAPDASLDEIMTEDVADMIIEKVQFITWRGGKVKKLVLPPSAAKDLAEGISQYTSDLMKVKMDGSEMFVSKVEAKHVLGIKDKVTIGELALELKTSCSISSGKLEMK